MRLLKRLFFLAFLLVLIGSGLSVYWIDKELKTPHQHGASSDLIEIEPGMGKKAIINRLTQKGIITHRLPVLAYLALRPQAGKLQAGEYRFESPITPLAVLV